MKMIRKLKCKHARWATSLRQQARAPVFAPRREEARRLGEAEERGCGVGVGRTKIGRRDHLIVVVDLCVILCGN